MQSNAVKNSILPCCIAFCQNGMCALDENGRVVDPDDVIGWRQSQVVVVVEYLEYYCTYLLLHPSGLPKPTSHKCTSGLRDNRQCSFVILSTYPYPPDLNARLPFLAFQYPPPKPDLSLNRQILATYMHQGSLSRNQWDLHQVIRLRKEMPKVLKRREMKEKMETVVCQCSYRVRSLV